MADTLTTISNFINSPPGQLTAGAVLAGIVWKFFEKVESVLKDDTKHEIARWLRVRNFETGIIANPPKPWPDTFTKVFDRVFGERHFTTKCLLRSFILTIILYGVFYCVVVVYNGGWIESFTSYTVDVDVPPNSSLHFINPHISTTTTYSDLVILPVFLAIAAIGDYLTLLETRVALAVSVRKNKTLVLWVALVADAVVTSATAIFIMHLNIYFQSSFHGYGKWTHYGLNDFLHPPKFLWFELIVGYPQDRLLWFYPAFFTSIWLWLYAASGFLLKAARRFDIAFAWFNRKFDIEKKPLSAIGLVAGALVAVLWWTVVIVKWLV
jgi:hypothetical protein